MLSICQKEYVSAFVLKASPSKFMGDTKRIDSVVKYQMTPLHYFIGLQRVTFFYKVPLVVVGGLYWGDFLSLPIRLPVCHREEVM